MEGWPCLPQLNQAGWYGSRTCLPEQRLLERCRHSRRQVGIGETRLVQGGVIGRSEWPDEGRMTVLWDQQLQGSRMIDHSADGSERGARLGAAGLVRPEGDINNKGEIEEKENVPACGSTRVASVAPEGPVVELAAGHYQQQCWDEGFPVS